MGNSGASMLAVQRTAAENAGNNVNNWLARLQGVGQQGVGITGQMIGLDQSYYGGTADRAIGKSNALVSNDTNATIAANNARMSGTNNLLSTIGNIGGTAARAYMGGR